MNAIQTRERSPSISTSHRLGLCAARARARRPAPATCRSCARAARARRRGRRSCRSSPCSGTDVPAIMPTSTPTADPLSTAATASSIDREADVAREVVQRPAGEHDERLAGFVRRLRRGVHRAVSAGRRRSRRPAAAAFSSASATLSSSLVSMISAPGSRSRSSSVGGPARPLPASGLTTTASPLPSGSGRSPSSTDGRPGARGLVRCDRPEPPRRDRDAGADQRAADDVGRVVHADVHA